MKIVRLGASPFLHSSFKPVSLPDLNLQIDTKACQVLVKCIIGDDRPSVYLSIDGEMIFQNEIKEIEVSLLDGRIMKGLGFILTADVDKGLHEFEVLVSRGLYPEARCLVVEEL